MPELLRAPSCFDLIAEALGRLEYAVVERHPSAFVRIGGPARSALFDGLISRARQPTRRFARVPSIGASLPAMIAESLGAPIDPRCSEFAAWNELNHRFNGGQLAGIHSVVMLNLTASRNVATAGLQRLLHAATNEFEQSLTVIVAASRDAFDLQRLIEPYTRLRIDA